MPKIIPGLRERLIKEAEQQLVTGGYTALTIRSVAKACHVAVGTVYNYFPSKDALLANYLLEDWKQCIAAAQAVSTYSETPKPVLRCIYDQLLSFAGRHEAIFRDEAASAAFAAASRSARIASRRAIWASTTSSSIFAKRRVAGLSW